MKFQIRKRKHVLLRIFFTSWFCSLTFLIIPTHAAFTGPFTSDIEVGSSLALPGGILDTLYGLNNLTRIDDFDVLTTDRYWTYSELQNDALAAAQAKYASFNHDFGFLPGQAGSDFQVLFNSGPKTHGIFDDNPATDPPPAPTPQAFSAAQTGDIFRFGLDIISKPGWLWSSLPADNELMPGGFIGDGIDHMVTWLITDNIAFPENVIGNYVIAWEDLSVGGQLGQFDGDYGDLVVEIIGVEPVNNPDQNKIPEPTTWILFASSALLFRIRNRKK
jgi:hypothetical protein